MIPKHIKPFLWSYDTNKIDPQKDKKIIISNILMLGDKKATDWLFKKYNKKELIEVAKNIPTSQWDKKSLNFWSIILNFKPKKQTRL